MSNDIYQAEDQTQADLFLLRSRARTADIQRRSQMNETIDRDEDADREILANYQKNTMNKLLNSEETIVQLLKQNSAFLRTIRQLAEVWGKHHDPDPLGFADRVIESNSHEIGLNMESDVRLREWARAQISSGNRLTIAKAKAVQNPPKA